MTYSYSYTVHDISAAPSVPDYTVALVLTVGTPYAGGSVQLTAVSGTWHGQTVLQLLPVGAYTDATGIPGRNDNLVYPDLSGAGTFTGAGYTANSYVDRSGFAFSVDVGTPGAVAGDDGLGEVLVFAGPYGSASASLQTLEGTASRTVGNQVFTACFCHGTLITTAAGPVAVQELGIGDEVVTWSGEVRPIRWIGRRSYGARFVAAHPHLRPIQIRAGALDDGVPSRDLFVSPSHALFLNGHLIPARALVNGTTIMSVSQAAAVHYFHIELDDHDVIFAEGAATETFLDDDSRHIFHNVMDAPIPPPSPFAPRYCAPRTEAGYAFEAVLAQLRTRANPRAAA